MGSMALANATRHNRRVTSRWTHGTNVPAPKSLQAIFVALSLSGQERERFRSLWLSDYRSPERVERRRMACDRRRGHRNGMTDEEYTLVRRAQTRLRVRRFRERMRLKTIRSFNPQTNKPTTQNKETQK